MAKDKCSHCAMDLDYCIRWLLMVPSHRIIALWLRRFRVHGCDPALTRPRISGRESGVNVGVWSIDLVA